MSKKCVVCDTEIKDRRSDAKYCSGNCRSSAFYKNSHDKYLKNQEKYKNKKLQLQADLPATNN